MLATKLSLGRWKPAKHLKLLGDWLIDLTEGRRKRIIVTMPPRHGKSQLISHWTPVWYLNKFPRNKIILASHQAQFAAMWGRQARNTIVNNQDDLTVRVAGDSSAADRWETTEGGGMYTAGVGGAITGKGANLLIIDDTVKNWQDANSITIRNRIWDWWQSTAYTRLEPGAPMVVVMTRWHEDDLVGRLLAGADEGHGHWDLLNLPAFAESGDMMGREEGQPLWPERFGVEALLEKQQTLDLHVWLPLYQQRPPSAGGIGNVYHAYSDQNKSMLTYSAADQLCWSLDFNVDPMCSVIAQIHDVTDRVDAMYGRRTCIVNVLDEICLPNSHTEEACSVFKQHTEKYRRGRQLSVHVYGDPSGSSRKTSNRSDYQIIKEYFAGDGNYRLEFKIKAAHPAVKDRTNAVNSMLCNSAGERHLFIDPQCRELEKDFKSVKWKRDMANNPTGDIDKSAMARTHASDALGYFIEYEFGLRSSGGPRASYVA